MLSNHEHERKVVHAQGKIKEFVGIAEEDDILDGLFCPGSILRCLCIRWISLQHRPNSAKTLTFKLSQDLERRFIIRGTFPHVSGQYCVGVMENIPRLQFCSDQVTNLVDFGSGLTAQNETSQFHLCHPGAERGKKRLHNGRRSRPKGFVHCCRDIIVLES